MRYIGIDLGTTNSTLSIANINVNGDITPSTLEIRQPDESGIGLSYSEILPSSLFIDKTETHYVGNFANRMVCIYPERVIRKVKRHIGKDVSWKVDGRTYRPEMVSSYVLKVLKTQAQEYFGEEKLDSAVITVPASFNFQQDNATRLAAELAGFDKTKIHTIPEPTAALIDYINEEQKKEPGSRRLNLGDGPKNLMVFDLGGGTCDVSILRVSELKDGEIKIQEISTSQYMELGGIDFDQIVSNKLLEQLLKIKGISMVELRNILGKSELSQLKENLMDIAEKARKSFSMKIDMVLRNEDIDYYENSSLFDDYTYKQALVSIPDELKHTFVITKREYDDVIKSLLYEGNKNKNIEYPVRSALKDAVIGSMSFEEIDAVFAVGGMIQYQTILHRIYEIFGRRIKPLRSINPMTSVSRGAAVYHYYIDRIHISSVADITEGEMRKMKSARGVVTTLTAPQNIYINVVQGEPITLLEKGTPAPYCNIFQDKFVVAGKYRVEKINAMELELFTAEDNKSSNITSLKSAILKFKKPVPVGAKVTLKVEFSEDRKVTVSAWLKDNPDEIIDVNIGEHEFSKEEIDVLRKSQDTINKVEKGW